jgi:quercetin dioxygenase-like cupin family protein
VRNSINNVRFRPVSDPGDPDDYRPRSEWAVVVDPADGSVGPVRSLGFVLDRVASGDRVPSHRHPIDEAIVIESGTAEVTLGDEVREVEAGSVVFIPATTPHGARNTGRDHCRILGVFPSDVVGVEYLERNPAPGTEGDAPKPASTWGLRSELD